jgi:hypothetical protein
VINILGTSSIFIKLFWGDVGKMKEGGESKYWGYSLELRPYGPASANDGELFWL